MEHKGVLWLGPMNKAFIGSKNYTKQNLKKASRSKLLELCKTRGKESSPDLFTFQVALAGHDKFNVKGNVTTCRRKFKDASLRTKSTKKEGPSENRGLIRKTVWRFQKKVGTETIFTTFKKPSATQRNQLIESNEQGLHKQQELH